MIGLIVSKCHGAPASKDIYTDILERRRVRYVCDACSKPCWTEREAE